MRERLLQNLPTDLGPELGDPAVKRAAVAMILRGDDDPEVLLIRRAEHPGDPWSGHMAFPGGRFDPADANLRETAIRETIEEIGLDLSAHATLLGRIEDQPAYARGKRVNMVIRPFVFWLDREPPPFVRSTEVDEVVFARVMPMLRGEVPAELEHEIEGRTVKLAGHRVGERIVWGLTYRMLSNLFASL